MTNSHPGAQRAGRVGLALGALGVVFGDIGTSPLYALKTAFGPEHGIPLTADNVMGILSLIVWSMVWVITLKYLFVMMRADNNGEGGILSLTALASASRKLSRVQPVLLGLGVLGAHGNRPAREHAGCPLDEIAPPHRPLGDCCRRGIKSGICCG